MRHLRRYQRYTLYRTSTNVFGRKIGRDGTVPIRIVSPCFNCTYNSNSRFYTVIYTDKLILLEMDDETMTLGLGIVVEIDEEWLASFGE